jgi:hypothetical protein
MVPTSKGSLNEILVLDCIRAALKAELDKLLAAMLLVEEERGSDMDYSVNVCSINAKAVSVGRKS